MIFFRTFAIEFHNKLHRSKVLPMMKFFDILFVQIHECRRYSNANKLPNILTVEIVNYSPRTIVLSDENLKAPSCMGEYSEAKCVQIFKIIFLYCVGQCNQTHVSLSPGNFVYIIKRIIG